jgi:pentatricopeptide repeat protein
MEVQVMREYKLVYLNKGFSASREKDIEKAEKLINEMADQGWILQQIATPDDGVGAMVGVFYKERKL